MTPDLARAACTALCKCRKADGFVHHAVGIPYDMSDQQVVESLAQGKWRCFPKALHSKKQWGKKTLVVKALTEPNELTVRVRFKTRIHPVRLVLQNNKLDPLEQACKQGLESHAKTKPTPKAEPRLAKVAPPHRRSVTTGLSHYSRPTASVNQNWVQMSEDAEPV